MKRRGRVPDWVPAKVVGHLEPNVLKRRKGPRALVVWYGWRAVTSKDSHWHPNRRMTRKVIETLDNAGFIVDALLMRSYKAVNPCNYDVIIGKGEAFYQLILKRPKCNAHFIHIMENAHPIDMAAARLWEMAQANALLGGRTVRLSDEPLQRRPLTDKLDPPMLADAIVTTGNSWTISSIARYTHAPVFRAPVLLGRRPPARDDGKRPPRQDAAVAICNNDFVIKALRLTLQAFAQRPHYTLHLFCQPTPYLWALLGALGNPSNIVVHGFVDISSAWVGDLLADVPFIISTSLTEGGCAAVLQAMSAGLVPIATDSTSVDLQDFGFRIADHDVASVLDALDRAVATPDAELRRRAHAAAAYVEQQHHDAAFCNGVHAAIAHVADTAHP